MHPRTLRRHLAKEKTSFEALCAELRFDMARELLDLTDLPVGEISTALAYASPSVFADAFRRWSGLSPMAFRAPHGPPPETRRRANAEAVTGQAQSPLLFAPHRTRDTPGQRP